MSSSNVNVGVQRSPLWEETRKAYLAKNPKCAVCGDTTQPQVHHMFPFHYVVTLGREDLELDERNFVTLCEDNVHDHHFLIGHLEDWKSYNPPASPQQLQAYIKEFTGKAAAAIKVAADFNTAHSARPPHLDLMTPEQKTKLKALLDSTFPADAALLAKARAARAKLGI